MTLEIYSYLLIRTYLINQDTEFLDFTNEENKSEQFKYFVDSVAMLMQNDDFLVLNPCMQDRISEIIQKNRFDFIKDKEINSQVNFIIGRLREYKDITPRKRSWMIYDFYKDECKDRLLPFKYRNYDYVNAFICYDYSNINTFTEPTKVDFFEGSCATGSVKVSRLISYLATLNLIISRASDSFDDEAKLAMITNICGISSALKTTSEEFRYMKKTAKHIVDSMENVEEEDNEKVKRLEK